MKLSDFSKATRGWFTSHYRRVLKILEENPGAVAGDFALPASLKLVETPTHFIAELLGHQSIPHSSRFELAFLPVQSSSSTTSYLNPGTLEDQGELAILGFAGNRSRVSGGFYCNEVDGRRLQAKLPRFSAQVQLICKAAVHVFRVPPDADFWCIDRLAAAATCSSRVYFRWYHLVLIIRRQTPSKHALAWLDQLAQEDALRQTAFGLYPIPAGKPRLAFAASLATIADQPVKENFIDQFLRQHSETFSRSLGYASAISQLELPVLVNEFGEAKSFRPDYLMLLPDGKCDILDLKRGLLRDPIVHGRPGRERFREHVQELIPQLEGYRRYFSYPEHRRWLSDNRGVTVDPDSVRLVGVVGTADTASRDDIERVMGQYHERISILSYSDVVALAMAVM